MERLVEAMKLRDERGFTTAGVVVALLVTLALVFSAAQVYRVRSASAEVQEVADVAALAAEGQVADFLWVVHKADAVTLSMTLLSIALFALGVVALCLPVADSLAPKLLEYAQKVLEARNSFAERAAEGLGRLQEALPFLAAAKAAACARANDGTGAAEASYVAVALLVPAKGEPIEVPAAEGLEGFGEDVADQSDEIKRKAAEAEQAAKRANEAKERGFQADCGADPGYCQYERAAQLANLPAGSNPLYHAVDAWSFSVALERARAYYAARLAQEAPQEAGVKEQARSALRKRFYAYAVDQLASGYVRDDGEGFSALFPELFRNTDQMRATPLYAEAAYPVTGAGGSQTMHAWPGCPKAAGASRYGSVAELDGGGFSTCEACEFTVSSLGNVAAASTSIENGFEHHYRKVAEAAADYARERAECDERKREVKGQVSPLLDVASDLMRRLGNARIEAKPPGRNGAIALVANVRPMAADEGFESSFVTGGRTLGTRAAVSGATLLADERHRGSELLATWANGLGPDAGGLAGAAALAVNAWTWLLRAYGDGQEALVEGVRKALDGIPLLSACGLGSWAADALTDAIATVGLQPAKLDVLKPVTVNTAHVAGAGSDEVAVRYAAVQQRARSVSSSSCDLFVGIVDEVERQAYDAIEEVSGGLVVAEVEFPVGGFKVPIRLTLPPAVKDAANGLVEDAAGALRGLYGSIVGLREWQ